MTLAMSIPQYRFGSTVRGVAARRLELEVFRHRQVPGLHQPPDMLPVDVAMIYKLHIRSGIPNMGAPLSGIGSVQAKIRWSMSSSYAVLPIVFGCVRNVDCFFRDSGKNGGLPLVDMRRIVFSKFCTLKSHDIFLRLRLCRVLHRAIHVGAPCRRAG